MTHYSLASSDCCLTPVSDVREGERRKGERREIAVFSSIERYVYTSRRKGARGM